MVQINEKNKKRDVNEILGMEIRLATMFLKEAELETDLKQKLQDGKHNERIAKKRGNQSRETATRKRKLTLRFRVYEGVINILT